MTVQLTANTLPGQRSRRALTFTALTVAALAMTMIAALLAFASSAGAVSDFTEADIATNEGKWFGASGTLFDYEYEYVPLVGGVLACGDQTFAVQVEYGTIVSATVRSELDGGGCSSDPVDLSPSDPGVWSVPELFGEARDVLAMDNSCRTITGSFEATLGYPVSINSDLGEEVEGGCAAVGGGVGFNVTLFRVLDHNADVQADLDAAMALWSSSHPDGYTMNYSPVCFCFFAGGSPLITVGEDLTTSNSSISHWNLASQSGPIPASYGPFTVADIFATIQDAITNGYGVTASFEPADGHPTGYFIDFNMMIADEEFGISVSSFTPALTVCGGLPASIIGDATANTLTGTLLDDVIWGGAGADSIDGGAGEDTLCGEDGADHIDAGPGSDTVFGGLGIDRIRGRGGNDHIVGGGGSDRIWGHGGSDTIDAGSGADRVWGGGGDDSITGSGGQDQIFGEDGNDSIDGNHQSDLLSGGLGNDIVRGHDGLDEIFGGEGDDSLFGGDNSDRLFGGFGDDLLHGQLGGDTCDGGPGFDTLISC